MQGRLRLKDRSLTVPFSSYVADVSKLAHSDDVKKDMYGKWLHSGRRLYLYLL